MFERFDVPCPLCGDRMCTRTSRQVTDLARELYLVCRNPAHGALELKTYAMVVADLHDGKYDGLHLPQSLRKQALAPVTRPHRAQLGLPNVETLPAHVTAPLGAGEYPCPCCNRAMKVVAANQRSKLVRELYMVCFSPMCPGKFMLELEHVLLLRGDASLLPELPRFVRRQALAPVADHRQYQLPGLGPPAAASAAAMT
ncbi:MAG: ogr/Delta-like zinc finger family protein [Moraxellaceae bacterium]|nr:ogr/Delta-like zinc finger family protein [Moraxellaceae bacterium]